MYKCIRHFLALFCFHLCDARYRKAFTIHYVYEQSKLCSTEDISGITGARGLGVMQGCV